MTVTTNKNKIIYEGNGVNSSFPFDFRVDEKDYLILMKQDLLGNLETVDSNNYEVLGLKSEGGSVVYPSNEQLPKLAVGEKLVILRELPLIQTIDLDNQGKFSLEEIERSFDSQVMMMQQLSEEISRSVKVQITDDRINPNDIMEEIIVATNEAKESATVAQLAGEQAEQSAVIAKETSEQAVIDITAQKTESLSEIETLTQEKTDSIDTYVETVVKPPLGDLVDEAESWATGDLTTRPEGSAEYWAKTINPETILNNTPFSIKNASKDNLGNPNFMNLNGGQIAFNGGIAYTEANGTSRQYPSVASIPMSDGYVMINNGIAEIVPNVKIGQDPYTPYVVPLQTSATNPDVITVGSQQNGYEGWRAFDGVSNRFFAGMTNSVSNFSKRELSTSFYCDGIKITNFAGGGDGNTKTINWYKDSTKSELIGTGLNIQNIVNNVVTIEADNILLDELYLEFPDRFGVYTPNISNIEFINPRLLVDNTVWFNPFNNECKQWNGSSWVPYTGVAVGKITNGIAETFMYNTQVNVTPWVNNASNKTKEAIVSLGMPDYNSAISGVGNNYTAPVDGIYIFQLKNSNSSINITINDILFPAIYNNYGTSGGTFITLSKGDEIILGTNPLSSWFVPMKGVK